MNKNRSLPAFALALALAPLAAQRAAADPVTLAVDSGASGASIDITVTVLGTDMDSQVVTWSGSVDADATVVAAPGGPRVDELEFQTSSIDQTDAFFDLTPGIPLPISMTGWHAVLEGPGGVLSGTPIGPGTTTFDLDGGALTFDEGILDVAGSALDNAEAPFSILFGPGDVATVSVTDGESGPVATISIPVTESAVVMESGVTVAIDIDGTLVLTGAVPAPAVPALSPVGQALLAAALLGLFATSRGVCRARIAALPQGEAARRSPGSTRRVVRT